MKKWWIAPALAAMVVGGQAAAGQNVIDACPGTGDCGAGGSAGPVAGNTGGNGGWNPFTGVLGGLFGNSSTDGDSASGTGYGNQNGQGWENNESRAPAVQSDGSDDIDQLSIDTNGD